MDMLVALATFENFTPRNLTSYSSTLRAVGITIAEATGGGGHRRWQLCSCVDFFQNLHMVQIWKKLPNDTKFIMKQKCGCTY
jgi:hypothetical protein